MSHAGTDNGSRILTADNLDHHVQQHPRTILSYLNDKITTFLMSEQASKLKQDIKIEGDLVTSFFESASSEYDDAIMVFLEEMKQDIDFILNILNNNPNEMIVFFTYLLVLLKKLTVTDGSFLRVTNMVKWLAKEINDEQNLNF